MLMKTMIRLLKTVLLKFEFFGLRVRNEKDVYYPLSI